MKYMGRARNVFVAVVAALVMLGSAPALADDLPAETPPAEAPVAAEVDTQQPPTPVRVLPRRCVGELVMSATAKACRVLDHGPSRPMVVVWGDSHSWQQTPAIIAAAKLRRMNLVTFQMGACPPMLLRQGESGGPCPRVGRLAMRFIETLVERDRQVTVVLGGYWHLYRTLAVTPDPRLVSVSQQARLWRMAGGRVFRALARMDVRTIGIGQQPTLGLDTPRPTIDLPRAQLMPREAAERKWLRSRVDRKVEPSSVLCGALTCRTTVDGVASYLEALHLNPAVAGVFTPLYRRAFRGHL